MLQRSLQQGSQPRLTMSLSPTLLSLLVDRCCRSAMNPGCSNALNCCSAATPMSKRRRRPQPAPGAATPGLPPLRGQCAQALRSAATPRRSRPADLCRHPRLPAAAADPSAAVQGQLRTAVREHERLIGEAPRGICCPNAPTSRPRSAAGQSRLATPFSTPTACCALPAPLRGVCADLLAGCCGLLWPR